MAARFRMKLEENSGVPVLRVSGDLVYGESLGELSETVREVVANGKTDVVVDLRLLENIDSSGLAALLNVRQIVGETGRALILGPPPRVRQALQTMRADAVFEMFADETSLRQHFEALTEQNHTDT